MTATEKTLGELRYEWGQHESSTRQIRIYALQKLSIYSSFVRGTDMNAFLKAILPASTLHRVIDAEKVAAFHEALDHPSNTRIFADLVAPLDLFRPFEIKMFEAAIGGVALHEAFVALEEYYDASHDNRFSAYPEFYYRLSLLLDAGVPAHEAIKVSGEKDRILYELVEEMMDYVAPDKPLSQFFVDANFSDWEILIIKVAESQGRLPEALKKLADRPTKSRY
jgi:hypothetical protein